MDQRKRPCPPRVDPHLVSSPQARCAGPGIRSQVAELRPASRVRHAASLPPRISIHDHQPPFNCYDADTWTEVTKHLSGRDLLRLSATSRWFRRFLADDTVWRYAFYSDFNLTAANPHTARPPHRSWRRLYLAAFNGSHAYWFRESDRHIVAWCLGGLLLDCSDLMLSATLPLPMWPLLRTAGVKHNIETLGACVMTNARPGVRIADLRRVRCPGCTFKGCQGVLQVLDARHSDAFLEKVYRDGTLQYEVLGEYLLQEKAASVMFATVLNLKHLASPSTASVLSIEEWTSIKSEIDALDVKTVVKAYAAAASDYNLGHNEGLQSTFQAMRDTAGDGKIVSVRILQLLL